MDDPRDGCRREESRSGARNSAAASDREIASGTACTAAESVTCHYGTAGGSRWGSRVTAAVAAFQSACGLADSELP